MAASSTFEMLFDEKVTSSSDNASKTPIEQMLMDGNLDAVVEQKKKKAEEPPQDEGLSRLHSKLVKNTKKQLDKTESFREAAGVTQRRRPSQAKKKIVQELEANPVKIAPAKDTAAIMFDDNVVEEVAPETEAEADAPAVDSGAADMMFDDDVQDIEDEDEVYGEEPPEEDYVGPSDVVEEEDVLSGVADDADVLEEVPSKDEPDVLAESEPEPELEPEPESEPEIEPAPEPELEPKQEASPQEVPEDNLATALAYDVLDSENLAEFLSEAFIKDKKNLVRPQVHKTFLYLIRRSLLRSLSPQAPKDVWDELASLSDKEVIVFWAYCKADLDLAVNLVKAGLVSDRLRNLAPFVDAMADSNVRSIFNKVQEMAKDMRAVTVMSALASAHAVNEGSDMGADIDDATFDVVGKLSHEVLDTMPVARG